jgi:hypothetical protein
MTLALVFAALVLLVIVLAAVLHRPRRVAPPPAHPRARRDARAALDDTGDQVDQTVFP